MLSNTATPKYYGGFRDKVLRGEIRVNRWIAMEMNRIDNLIKNPDIYYDPDPVEGWVNFCETELVLTDGSDLRLLDSFKLWGEQVWGWYYFSGKNVFVPDGHGGGKYYFKKVKKRLTKKQYLIVARAAAKSIYASCMQSFELAINPRSTNQIVVAPTMRQAEETLGPIRTALVRKRGPLFQFMTQGSINNTTGNRANRPMMVPTKKGIENFITNSILETRPLSIDKLQGLRVTLATVDEWLSGDLREDPIAAIEQGAAKEQSTDGANDYLIIAISSEGNVRNGAGDTIKMELESILRGEYHDPHTSIFYYRLDDIAEVNDPAMWIKANPNIGITVSYDTYHADVERAKANPSIRNEILAKRFGIPAEGYTYFFTYAETIPHAKKRYYGNMSCSMGADFSQGDDFCSVSFWFPLRDGFGHKTINFISEFKYRKLYGALKIKYDNFLKEGSLFVLAGTNLDMNEVYDIVNDYIDRNRFNIICFGYDPYNADVFVNRWIQEHSEYGVHPVKQGVRTESVPLGEIKHLAEERAIYFEDEIMSFCMGNAVTLEDTNGNRKLYKKRYEFKIDCVASTMDAHVAYKLHANEF